MPKLFTSFTHLLHMMAEGKVTQSDLDTGLFFFGCSRLHALAPWEPSEQGNIINEIEWAFDDKALGEKEHARIVEALLRGEFEGRVEWTKAETGRSLTWMEEVSKAYALAERNGIKVPDGMTARGSIARWLDEQPK